MLPAALTVQVETMSGQTLADAQVLLHRLEAQGARLRLDTAHGPLAQVSIEYNHITQDDWSELYRRRAALEKLFQIRAGPPQYLREVDAGQLYAAHQAVLRP
jgi:hypothetical protein